MKKLIHKLLRPAFVICLFLSQLFSARETMIAGNFYLVIGGLLLFAGGILLIVSAFVNLRKATGKNEKAAGSPFRIIRHPIYTGIYVFTVGLGLIFFTWLWFIVMAAFLPLWYRECWKEEKEMAKLHGQKYIDYQKRTGMIFPLIIKRLKLK